MKRAVLPVLLCLFVAGCARLISVAQYETFVERIIIPAHQPADARPPVAVTEALGQELETSGFHHFLWSQNGTLRGEWALAGRDPDESVDIKSVSKTLLSLLVGELINTGSVALHRPISQFGECAVPPAMQPMTVAQLLNMSASIEADEAATAQLFSQPDWACAILALPARKNADQPFHYATAQSQLLGIHLEDLTDQTAAALLQAHVLSPMGVTLDGWTQNPDGTTFAGSELRLQPRDMLRLGEVLAAGGIWQGDQVVPAAWLARMKIPAFAETGRADIGFGWGLWHWDGGVFAEGYGGQAIVIRGDAVLVFAAPSGGLVSGATHDARMDAILAISKRLAP